MIMNPYLNKGWNSSLALNLSVRPKPQIEMVLSTKTEPLIKSMRTLKFISELEFILMQEVKIEYKSKSYA